MFTLAIGGVDILGWKHLMTFTPSTRYCPVRHSPSFAIPQLSPTWLYVIIATHNPSKMAAHNFAVPARLGRLGPYTNISHSENRAENLSRLLFIFQLLTPKCIGYRRPIQRQRYHKASAILNSVSHHTHKLPVIFINWVVYLGIITIHFAQI